MKLQNKILLITGWGVGIEPLHSLKLGLTKAGCDTQLINIFNVLDGGFHDQLDFLTDIDVVVGWSLGGQLATYLANSNMRCDSFKSHMIINKLSKFL
ncbi:hypothetical protein A7907_06050 [Acinetobacter baumannii]|nr:hypothetical protein A7907_06050 [Acinetobacter baumannii]